MNKLIKYFNEVYGKEYGKIAYPRTTVQIYQAYQIIKSYGIKDDDLLLLLGDTKLPKPKTIEEREMYSECLYEIGSKNLPKLSEFENDLYYRDKEITSLKLTKEDFYVIWGDEYTCQIAYKKTPNNNLFLSLNDFYKFDYKFTYKFKSEKEKIVYGTVNQKVNKNNVIGIHGFNYGLSIGRMCIFSGGYEDPETGNVIPDDCFYSSIEVYGDYNLLEKFEFEIIQNQSKKIPKDALDIKTCQGYIEGVDIYDYQASNYTVGEFVHMSDEVLTKDFIEENGILLEGSEGTSCGNIEKHYTRDIINIVDNRQNHLEVLIILNPTEEYKKTGIYFKNNKENAYEVVGRFRCVKEIKPLPLSVLPLERIQADWDTDNSNYPSYIKNKPTIPYLTSQLYNNSGFIDKTTLNNMIKFNENGELVITINGVTKTFVPKSE